MVPARSATPPADKLVLPRIDVPGVKTEQRGFVGVGRRGGAGVGGLEIGGTVEVPASGRARGALSRRAVHSDAEEGGRVKGGASPLRISQGDEEWRRGLAPLLNSNLDYVTNGARAARDEMETARETATEAHERGGAGGAVPRDLGLVHPLGVQSGVEWLAAKLGTALGISSEEALAGLWRNPLPPPLTVARLVGQLTLRGSRGYTDLEFESKEQTPT